MKNLFFILFILFISSCADFVGEGVLLRPSEIDDLLFLEKENIQILFGEDVYWRVKMKSGDTINAILPDFIHKINGDSVCITVEGSKKNFFVVN